MEPAGNRLLHHNTDADMRISGTWSKQFTHLEFIVDRRHTAGSFSQTDCIANGTSLRCICFLQDILTDDLALCHF